MEISLRQATPEDGTALATLFLEVRRATFVWKNPTEFTLADFEAQTVAEAITIAENERGELLGFISVWEPDSFIHHLYVAQRFQGQGVGRMLMESLTSWLPLPHRLKYVEDNQRAGRFYRRQGWEEIGRGFSSEGPYLLLQKNPPSATPADHEEKKSS
ncbi:MAG: GNAT family N-acetyltransferase [Opitutaceae bacterium]|nr:GNAT family N-acetyltransferase [Opitutaceae bacterium]